MKRLISEELYEDVLGTLNSGKVKGAEKLRLETFLACAYPMGLYSFAQHVCGFRDLGEMHVDLCQQLDEWEFSGEAWQVVLLPRGHFKSSLVNTARLARRIMFYHPEQEELLDWVEKESGVRPPETKPPSSAIISWSAQRAAGFLVDLRNVFRRKELVDMFPWVLYESPKKEADKWTQTDLKMKNGAKVEAWSLESQRIGNHVDNLLFDDAEVPASVTNEEQLRKLKDNYALTQSIKNPGGTTEVTGTFYHHDGLYANLKDGGQFKVYLKSALVDSDDPAHPLGRKPIFHERFTYGWKEEGKEDLADIEKIQGPYIFGCQYEMNPQPLGMQVFKPYWFRTDCPVAVPNAVHTLAVDPAMSKDQKSACFSALTVFASTPGAGGVDRWLVEVIREKGMDENQLIECIFSLHARFKFAEVGVEAIVFQMLIANRLQEEARRRGVWMNVTPIKFHRRSKGDRIRGMVPDFAQGRVHMREDMPHVMEELREFPDGKYRDVIDSMSMHWDLDAFNQVAAYDRASKELVDLRQRKMLRNMYGYGMSEAGR